MAKTSEEQLERNRKRHAERMLNDPNYVNRKRERQRAWRSANAERLLARQREIRAEKVQNDPDFVLRHREQSKKSYWNTEEKRKERLKDLEYLEYRRARDREWYAKNRETILERKREQIRKRKIEDPIFAKKCSDVNALYHKEHKEELRIKKREYMKNVILIKPDIYKIYHANSRDKRLEYTRNYAKTEKGKASRKKYEENHPYYVRQKTQVRRARKKNTQVEPIKNIVVFDRDRWVCQICKQVVDVNLEYPHPFSASLDHVIPLSKGGTHTMDNIQLAHLVCNVKKHAKLEAV